MSQINDKPKEENPKPEKPDKKELDQAIDDKKKTLATNQIVTK